LPPGSSSDRTGVAVGDPSTVRSYGETSTVTATPGRTLARARRMVASRARVAVDVPREEVPALHEVAPGLQFVGTLALMESRDGAVDADRALG